MFFLKGLGWFVMFYIIGMFTQALIGTVLYSMGVELPSYGDGLIMLITLITCYVVRTIIRRRAEAEPVEEQTYLGDR